jgi:hypothetical protein
LVKKGDFDKTMININDAIYIFFCFTAQALLSGMNPGGMSGLAGLPPGFPPGLFNPVVSSSSSSAGGGGGSSSSYVTSSAAGSSAATHSVNSVLASSLAGAAGLQMSGAGLG